MVPGNAQLDLKAMARLTGDRKVDTVSLKEVQPLTGYVRGGVTALGAKKAYPVYADETIELFEVVLHLGRRARHPDPRRSRRVPPRDQGEGRRHRAGSSRRRRGLNARAADPRYAGRARSPVRRRAATRDMTRAACDLRDPSELSTAELRQRCRGCRPWELGLGAVQLAASAAAGGAVLAAAGACIPGLVQCISVGPALAAGLAVWESIGVARGGSRARRTAMSSRSGAWHAGLSPWVGPAAQRRWARRALARRPAAPDWLLVLEGVAPAGGGRRWVKVELSLSPPRTARSARRPAGTRCCARAATAQKRRTSGASRSRSSTT